MGKKSFLSRAANAAFNAIKTVVGVAARLLWLSAKFFLKTLFTLFSLVLPLIKKIIAAVASKRVSLAQAPKATYSPLTPIKEIEGNLDKFEEWLYSSKSTVGIIIGARGSGKSGLGCRLLENHSAMGRKTYAMGFAQGTLPDWVEQISSIEQVSNGSVVLVDEGGILFSSRQSCSQANKLLSQLLFIARHKDLSLLFISQNSANLEVNTLRQADYLLLKRPSLLQKDFERSKTREVYEQAAKGFKELQGKKGSEGLAYVYSDQFTGYACNSLPSFWSESASKAFGKTVFKS